MTMYSVGRTGSVEGKFCSAALLYPGVGSCGCGSGSGGGGISAYGREQTENATSHANQHQMQRTTQLHEVN